METNFSDFNRYKEIRNYIREFSHDETFNKPFTSFFKEEYYYDYAENLNKFLKKVYKLSLDDFFEKYREKIYNDKKFTNCCGFLDVILYHYDKSYKLGGRGFSDPVLRYTYGYQNYSLGITYIKQNFGTLSNFYNEVAKEKISYYIKNDSYSKIINNIEDCTLIFAPSDSFERRLDEEDEDFMEFYDNVVVIFIGDNEDRKKLKESFDEGYIEDYVDFEQIKTEIEFYKTTKNFNL